MEAPLLGSGAAGSLDEMRDRLGQPRHSPPVPRTVPAAAGEAARAGRGAGDDGPRPQPAAQASDRRRCPRVPTRVSLFLHYQGQPIALGDALDLSPRGLFTVPRPELAAVYVGMPVDVSLGIEHAGVTRRYRIASRVAHHTEKGIGLAFTKGDRQLEMVVDVALRLSADEPL